MKIVQIVKIQIDPECDPSLSFGVVSVEYFRSLSIGLLCFEISVAFQKYYIYRVHIIHRLSTTVTSSVIRLQTFYDFRFESNIAKTRMYVFKICTGFKKSLFWNNSLLLCAGVFGRVQPIIFSTNLLCAELILV